MALEPMAFSLGDAKKSNPEIQRDAAPVLASVPPSVVLLVLMFLGMHQPWIEFVLATPVVLWAGWPFFERGWASMVNRSLNMFTLIARGNWRGVGLQRRRDCRARDFPRIVARIGGHVRGLLRAAAVITDVGAAGTGAGIARARSRLAARSRLCCVWRQRRRGAFARTAKTRMYRSNRCIPGDNCACGRVKKFRWTAWSGRLERGGRIDGHAASRSRWRKTPGDRVTGGTVNGTGAFVMRAERVGAGHAAGAHRRDGERSAAFARANSAAGRRGGGLVRAGGDRGSDPDVPRVGDLGARSRAWPMRW